MHDINLRENFYRNALNESKLIPKCLKPELEPTIGNHNQEFLDRWQSNLEKFSLTLIEGIVKFCDKTMSETAAHITSTEKALKQSMEKEEFQKIKETISRNEEATKRILKQKKIKKFNYLKHKTDTERNQKTSQTTTTQDTLSPIYASILKNNTNIPSNIIKQNTNPTGERPTLQQKLQSFTSKHSRSRSKSPRRKASKTNQQNQSNEIAALKVEIEELKQQKQNSNNTGAKTQEESNSISENSKTTQHPKDVQEASKGGQPEKEELLSVIKFIKETTNTLATYRKQLKSQLDISLIQTIKMMTRAGCSNKITTIHNHHTINTYVEAVKKDIDQSKTVTPRKLRPNLSKDEKVALKDLSKRDDIIITNVDKGSAVVIMDVNDYIREGKYQLNDSKNCKVLAKDPTTTNNNLVNQTIGRFTQEQLINENIANGLKNPSPRAPQFYISPKIHKEGNPGRPAVSSINCHTANISKYVDHHLQPIVKQIPSYVKDMKNFTNKMNAVKSVPKNSYLVTMDMRSLYTNIPNAEGISAVKRAFGKYSKKTTTTKVIKMFLALILTLNNFVFNCIHYLQIKGCAMGTICAPAYANIFMANYELKYIYPYIRDKTKNVLKVY